MSQARERGGGKPDLKPKLPGSPELEDDEEILCKYALARMPEAVAADKALAILQQPVDHITNRSEGYRISKYILGPVIDSVLQRPDIAELRKKGDTTWLQLVPMEILDTSVKQGFFARIKNAFFRKPIRSRMGPWTSKDYAVVVHFAVTELDLTDTEKPEEEAVAVATPHKQEDGWALTEKHEEEAVAVVTPPKQEDGWALLVLAPEYARLLAQDCLQAPSTIFQHLVDTGVIEPDEQVQSSTGQPAQITLGEHLVVLSNNHLKGTFKQNYTSKNTF